MTAYTVLTDAELDPDKPVTSAKMKALRDNPLAIAEGDNTAPKYGTGVVSCRFDVSGGVLSLYGSVASIDGFVLEGTWNNTTKTLDMNISSSAGSWSNVSYSIQATCAGSIVTPQMITTRRVGGITQVGAVNINLSGGSNILTDLDNTQINAFYDRADPLLPTP